MSLLAESYERHKRFHAEIARRAALVPQKEKPKSHFIPNTPFGVAKLAPEFVKAIAATITPARNYMQEWHHCMWFYDLIGGEERPEGFPPTIERIQEAVASFYGVSRDDLTARYRTAKVIRPRHVAMYLCKKLTKRSYPQIAKRFGGRDHSTGVHAFQKISDQLLHDEKLFSDIATLTAMVQL